jgi:Fic family protein
LESIAKVQSVKGSNEIEGIVTSEQRINEIVNQNSAPLNHNEAEIAGYRDALALIHSDYAALDVRERDILRLHDIMLSYSPNGGGRYKDGDNVIMEVDASGARRVRFEPTPAAETVETMEQLILAYMDARDNSAVNRLLLIPCFILDFLCIHPFSDGNGRISRLLSLLLLYKSGFDAGRYISFEEQINSGKAGYYKALKDSSDGWRTGGNSYFPFIENFITTLLMCYKELDKRFAAVNSGKVGKRERIEATVLNSLLPISKREVCYILPDVSPTTVEAVIASMLKSGVIVKVGSARNTKYVRR